MITDFPKYVLKFILFAKTQAIINQKTHGSYDSLLCNSI